MSTTTEVQETKVLWDVSSDQLYVWDKASKAWELFYSAASLVTEDALTQALETKLDVTGGTISGALSITKTLSVTGAGTIGGALSVTGSATIGNALSASGNITSGGTVTGAVIAATGNATIGGTLKVTGAATFSDAAAIGGALSVTGSATVSGSTVLTEASIGNLSLNAATLENYSLATADSSYWGAIPLIRSSDGVMEIGRYVDFHDSPADTNDYSVRLSSSSGTLALTGALSVTGSATIGNALTASGNITSGGTVTGAVIAATGNATIGGTLSVTGAATLSGGISGALSVTGAITGSSNLTAAGSLAIGGASVDDNNVLIAQGANALFANPDGSFGFVFSKESDSDDATTTYQVNYATRAMVGLMGDNNYTIKVTPDASTWMTALVVDNATGAIEHTQGAKFEAVTNYNNYIAADTWTKIAFNSMVHNDYGAFSASNNRFTAPVDGYYLIGTKWLFYVNGTVPDCIKTKLYLNGSALDRTLAASSGTVTSGETTVQSQTLLSLSADDYVEIYACMETNDGYVYATGSLFYGARIA